VSISIGFFFLAVCLVIYLMLFYLVPLISSHGILAFVSFRKFESPPAFFFVGEGLKEFKLSFLVYVHPNLQFDSTKP
jgi:hypothetical protein